MSTVSIPAITEEEKKEGILLADASPRRRHPRILHQPGAEFNEVFNFMMGDSYMQPHLHPGEEKIEMIYLVQGKVAVLFFDDKGAVTKCTLLEKEGVDMIAVPAFTWHTYVMLSPSAITYETMMGKYDPQTWKDFFTIAPAENTPESISYLGFLKAEAAKWISTASENK
jgi:cupin fold WbuC family metalloprotein